MRKLLPIVLFMFPNYVVGQSLVVKFLDAGGNTNLASTGTGQTEQFTAQNGVHYSCSSFPTANPILNLNGTNYTGTFSGSVATVQGVFAGLPPTGSGYADFPYVYNVGGVLCGSRVYATRHVPITWKWAQVREGFGTWAFHSSSAECGGRPALHYTDFTAYCNGGKLPDAISEIEYTCTSNSTPPTGLWGFDDNTPCIYDSTGTNPYFCFGSFKTLLGNKINLIDPTVRLHTPGVCTSHGVTQ